MRSKALRIMVCMFLATVIVFSATAADTPKKPLNKMIVGYVMPWNLDWFAYLGDAFDMVMNANGVKTIRLLANWDAAQEASAVQDLINLKVDAINVTSGGPDSAQNVCKLANDAGIPISIEDAWVAPGPGKPFANIEFDWYGAGVMFANEISQRWPGSKIVILQGRAGVGPVELQNQGLTKRAKELGNIEIVALKYTDYTEAVGFSTMKDVIQSGLNFDVVVTGTEGVGEGAIEALESEGVVGKKVVDINGGPMDVSEFKKGRLAGAVGQSPGFHGMVVALTMLEYLKGHKIPDLVYTPIFWLSPENYEKTAMPWHMDKSWLPVAENFIHTGKLVY
jgi:ribose transport system substrate-binding protein